MATFEELGLGASVMEAIRQMGYTEATPVQEQAIPLVLAGHDVIAAAQTGTGKTAAFTLPVLDKLGHFEKGHGPKALIVTPTRELAQQIDSVARTVAKKTGHYVLTVVGGVSYNPQINGLRRGIDVLVATPGRLLDLYDRMVLDLNDIEVLVLDEADRMLDMGFWPDVKQIIDCIPADRQTLLFSATIDDSVMRTIGGEVKDPQFVEIAHKGTAAETVEQFAIPVSQHQKSELLEFVLDEKGSDRVIIFTRTKSRAEILAENLNRDGFSAEAIHGDRSQGQRSRALKNFRDGRVGIIVATDVLARGIDVSDVDHVINFDVPMDPEDYIHRIGRTGRAGEEGFSITFVAPDEEYDFYDIEYLMKKAVPEMEMPGFDFDDRRPYLDPERDATVRPRRGRKGGRGRGRGGRGGRGERFERGERRGGRGYDRGGRGERGHEGNFERTERAERREESVERDIAALNGGEVSAPAPAAEAANAVAVRTLEERRAARFAETAARRERAEAMDRAEREQRRAEREQRGDRGFDRGDRGGRGGRGGRSFDRGGRGGRGYDRRDDRDFERSFDRRDDRDFDRRDDRRDDRPSRGYDRRDDRGYDRGEKYGEQRRGYDRRDDRRENRYGADRDSRSGARPFDRDERRGGRDFDRPREDRGYDRRDGHKGSSSRGEGRVSSRYEKGSFGQNSSPKQYGMQRFRKPGDHGGDR